MKNIFEPATIDGLVQRINKLTPEAQRQWGKMDVAQMLAHCANVLDIAVGDKQGKRTIMGYMFGGYVKKIITDDKPFKRDSPTNPDFKVAGPREFDKERERLLGLLLRFHNNGSEAAANIMHPFFGKLTAEEWSRSTYKHLDHHLQQFGV